MSDPRMPSAALPRELPADEAAREERHQLLATLLGAFADGELPAETASQIDAHLLGCPRCRRELLLQRTLRLRLEQEPLATASASLRSRIIATIAATPAPQWEVVAEAVATADLATATPWRNWDVLRRAVRTPVVAWIVVSLALGALGMRWLAEHNSAPPASIVSASSVPLFASALADYRKVTRGNLPGRARDLAVVRDAMPFPVQALQAPGLRLLAAWTTSLDGEPTAVFAYRWNDHVVLQYLVSETQLYRPARLRSAFANGYGLGAHDGSQSVLAWPEAAWGSLVIADIALDRLRLLRGTAAAR